jgi:hypothetical protein
MMTEIVNDTIQVQTINSLGERRRAMIWYDYASCYYEGLQQVANMMAFRQNHAAAFHTVGANEVWKEYTQEFYQMDTYYRNFHLEFQKALHVMNPRLDDGFKAVADNVEGLYNHWFLAQLSACWANASDTDLKDLGGFPGVPQLTNFYAEKVKPADTRVFVIVSDAMRYEVAAVLADQLRRETQSKVTLKAGRASSRRSPNSANGRVASTQRAFCSTEVRWSAAGAGRWTAQRSRDRDSILKKPTLRASLSI